MIKSLKVYIFLCFAALFCASCTTSRVIGNTNTPAVEIESSGIIWVGDRQAKMGKIGKTLKSEGFKRDQQVKVLVADKNDRQLMNAVKSDLRRSGFTRIVFITDKITQSATKKR